MTGLSPDFCESSISSVCALPIEYTKRIGDNEYLFKQNARTFRRVAISEGRYTELFEEDKTKPSYQRVPSPNCLVKAISL
jgi:hypothetical protein